jgi:hypothetical protein
MGGKNKKTGASELLAFSHICGLGLDDIQEGVCVTLDGHRYEPDFAYIDKSRGIYIDIEVDEPYTSDHRPTHYIEKVGKHKDMCRNELFCNHGWYVVRFTEQQMFCQTASCMKAVYELVCKAGGADNLPTTLTDAPELETESCWTYDDSIKKSYQNYRRTYLGFDPINMGMSSMIKCLVLALPLLRHALINRRLSKMLTNQLKRYFM